MSNAHNNGWQTKNSDSNYKGESMSDNNIKHKFNKVTVTTESIPNDTREFYKEYYKDHHGFGIRLFYSEPQPNGITQYGVSFMIKKIEDIPFEIKTALETLFSDLGTIEFKKENENKEKK